MIENCVYCEPWFCSQFSVWLVGLSVLEVEWTWKISVLAYSLSAGWNLRCMLKVQHTFFSFLYMHIEAQMIIIIVVSWESQFTMNSWTLKFGHFLFSGSVSYSMWLKKALYDIAMKLAKWLTHSTLDLILYSYKTSIHTSTLFQYILSDFVSI